MALRRDDFPLPDVADPLTAAFFAGAARGELVIPRCEQCARFVWYPAPECPARGRAGALARGHLDAAGWRSPHSPDPLTSGPWVW